MKLKYKNVPNNFGKNTTRSSPLKQTSNSDPKNMFQKFLGKYDVNDDGTTSGEELKFAAKEGIKSLWSSAKPAIDEMADTGGGAGINVPDGKASIPEYAMLAAGFIMPGGGSKNVTKGLISKAKSFFNKGVVNKTAVNKNVVNNASNKVQKFKMNNQQLEESFTMHGAESQMVKNAKTGKIQEAGAFNYWYKPVKNSKGEAVIKRNGKPFTQQDAARQNLFGAADDINNAEKGAMEFTYKGTESKRDVMQVSVIRNGQKKNISMIRSTSGGDKTLDWVDPATGIKHKVGSRGINYPAMDKSQVISNGEKTGASHWYKDNGWETGYGIKDFDKLGKGKFVPKRNAKGNFEYTENGALDGTWTGGQVGDELIKQTVEIID